MKRQESGDYNHDDGFRNTPDESDDSQDEHYVAWLDSTKQNVFYLHGALHLFYQRELLLKYCWNRTGVPLIDQIDAALVSNKFPLIVSEGESRQKLERIQKSSYLGKCHRSITKITGTLFTFGFAFSDNDKHITHQISKNTSIKKLCIGIFGDHESPNNLDIYRHAEALAVARPPQKPLSIEYYDAATARVWR